jgi:predicted alpha-1,6-mannanase (GH76 family)
MSITALELETIVEKMLVEGVPPGVVSRVFDLDLDLVKDEQRKVRIRKYGTEDLNDYMEQMQWDAIETARTTLATGSTAEKSRFVSAILGKQMTAAAKRTPEGEREKRDQVEEMFRKMREGE